MSEIGETALVFFLATASITMLVLAIDIVRGWK